MCLHIMKQKVCMHVSACTFYTASSSFGYSLPTPKQKIAVSSTRQDLLQDTKLEMGAVAIVCLSP